MREGGKLKEKTEESVTRKECQRLREEFEVGGLMAQQGLWNIANKEDVRRQRSALKKTETESDDTRRCMKKTFSAVG